jgi:hypothetical protein
LADEFDGFATAFLGGADEERIGLLGIPLEAFAGDEVAGEIDDGVPSAGLGAFAKVVDFFDEIGGKAAVACIHFDEVEVGWEIAGCNGALEPVNGLVGILLDSASAHVEFAEGAHDFRIAGLGQWKPVVVDAFVVQALDLHPELEEAVGTGAASFRSFCEEACGGTLVERNADAFEMEEAEFDLGIDVACRGGGLDFGDGALGRSGWGFFLCSGRPRFCGGWRGIVFCEKPD